MNPVSNVAELLIERFFAAALFPLSRYTAFPNTAFLTCGIEMEAA
ncbi:hypothetical protein [Bradyrhizobium sp. dw_411]|nr:hypothetical protein [Bradyrhizobium sp. dw_411]